MTRGNGYGKIDSRRIKLSKDFKTLDEYLAEQLKDPEFKAAFDALKEEQEVKG